jgi:hypothetical protein
MTRRPVILSLCLMLISPLAAADLVVIAHPQGGIEQLSQTDVLNIYLGRYRRLASGLTAEPIDLPGDAELKRQFYRKLVGKNLAEINAYWARLVFSGNTKPPRTVASAEEAMQRVARYPGALAYVDRKMVDKRVVIVFELNE